VRRELRVHDGPRCHHFVDPSRFLLIVFCLYRLSNFATRILEANDVSQVGEAVLLVRRLLGSICWVGLFKCPARRDPGSEVLGLRLPYKSAL